MAFAVCTINPKLVMESGTRKGRKVRKSLRNSMTFFVMEDGAMEEGLKGFSDYSDYQSYARVFLPWMNEDEHHALYGLLQKDQRDPIQLIRQMNVETYAKSLSLLALSSHG